MLPTRRIKKKVNTFVLDSQWCLPKNTSILSILCYLIILFLGVNFVFSYIRSSSFHEIQVATLETEFNGLQATLEAEVVEKKSLIQKLSDLQQEVELKKIMLSQKEQQLHMKAATMDDLKLGLSILESKIAFLNQQIEQYEREEQEREKQIAMKQAEERLKKKKEEEKLLLEQLKKVPEEEWEPQKPTQNINTNVNKKVEEERGSMNKYINEINDHISKAIPQKQQQQQQQQQQQVEERRVENDLEPDWSININNDNTDEYLKSLNETIAVDDKRNSVKNAMRHAWNSYKKYAWGKDELKPVTKRFHNWLDLGVTIVDALDTLWIMELFEEFTEARNWIAKSLSFDKNVSVSVFETTIRELGGLLSAYELSRDRMFLEKAEDLAERLLKGFARNNKIPHAAVNLKTGNAESPSWLGGTSVLSEIGTLQLEFLYLAYHTNKPHYAIKPLDVFKHLDSLSKDEHEGLYPLYIDITTGSFKGKEYSLGALGDSFYEYMLKLWLFTNKQFNGYQRMFQESSVGIKNVLVKTTPSGYRYMAQIRYNSLEQKMEHLACFSGGMYALGAVNSIDPGNESEDIELAGDLTTSCHESYTRTATKIGPEAFEFIHTEFAVPPRGAYYILRPEVIESYFVLWRTTHDPKYRDWAWEAFVAIETHCRVEGGYSGIQNVNSVPVVHDDLQQSFFLAETLKYLYLIFSDDDVIPLDQYVFNTEAHPLGIITELPDSWPQELRFHMIEF